MYLYIYVCVYVCVYIYIYINIYIYNKYKGKRATLLKKFPIRQIHIINEKYFLKFYFSAIPNK